jgi:hypothetical protein
MTPLEIQKDMKTAINILSGTQKKQEIKRKQKEMEKPI